MVRAIVTLYLLIGLDYSAAAQVRSIFEPTTAKEYYSRAESRAEQGDLDAAITDLTEAIRLDVNYAVAYRGRGSLLIRKGEYRNAIEDLTEAIRLDPMDAEAFSDRGMALAGRNKHDAAAKDLTESIRLNPFRSVSFINRGIVFARIDKYDAAIKDFSEAIRINPNKSNAYACRGRAFFFKGEYASAIKDLNKVIEIDPNEDNAIGSLAWVFATCPDGKYRDGKKGVELATKACELTKWKDYDSLDILAAAYAETGDWKNAVKRENEAIELAQHASVKEHGLSQAIRFRERLALYEENRPYREQSSLTKDPTIESLRR